MNRNPATDQFVRLVHKKLENNNVILLYGAKNVNHNNTVMLQSYLQKELKLSSKNKPNFVSYLYNDGEANRSKDLALPAEWLKSHPIIAKRFKLTFGRDNRIYHDSPRKALDHQSLMNLILKN